MTPSSVFDWRRRAEGRKECIIVEHWIPFPFRALAREPAAAAACRRRRVIETGERERLRSRRRRRRRQLARHVHIRSCHCSPPFVNEIDHFCAHCATINRVID